MAEMRKALVALSNDLWAIIDRDLKGTLGNGDSDTIRAIVISWLAEKGYLTKSATFEIVRSKLMKEGWIPPAEEK